MNKCWCGSGLDYEVCHREFDKKINYYKKRGGMTDAEKAEQQALRQEYVADVKASLRAQLNNTSIKEPDGTVHKLGKKN